jgi:hypothetical protein
LLVIVVVPAIGGAAAGPHVAFPLAGPTVIVLVVIVLMR